MYAKIIAEAGVNHNGDINIAKELIDRAAEAGVDYVKFQTFKTEKIVSKFARKAYYQKENCSDNGEFQFNMLKKLELSEENQIELMDYCKKRRIKFLSTPFDENSVDFLERLNLDFFKVPSGEITNKPFLRHIATKKMPVVMSTGMASLSEIEASFEVLLESGLKREQITILHCNTGYPTPYEDVNLKAMLQIKNKLEVNVGYSDHTLGIEVPIAAVALGATIIEKHFTLDRNLPGPDHKASLEPLELKKMVAFIRNVEKALSGSGEKIPSSSELNNINLVRKSIVASKNIKKGELLSGENLAVKRPGFGISPMMWDEIIGKKAKRDFERDEFIEI